MNQHCYVKIIKIWRYSCYDCQWIRSQILVIQVESIYLPKYNLCDHFFSISCNRQFTSFIFRKCQRLIQETNWLGKYCFKVIFTKFVLVDNIYHCKLSWNWSLPVFLLLLLSLYWVIFIIIFFKDSQRNEKKYNYIITFKIQW